MTSGSGDEGLSVDWLGLCRRAVQGIKRVLEGMPQSADRSRVVGSGAGGDETLLIDSRAEDVVFKELDALHGEGHSFKAVSEERGSIEYGEDPKVQVVIDPIDGSLNAKRAIPLFSISIAVATGNTMEDVFFGYVYDFGTDEEFWARAGEGATYNESRLDSAAPATEAGLEVVALEGASPWRVAEVAERLKGHAYRIRCFGSIAISLSYLACGRCDGLITLFPCRSVDAAAGQLIAREAAAEVRFIDRGNISVMQLDLDSRMICVAGRGEEATELLAEAALG